MLGHVLLDARRDHEVGDPDRVDRDAVRLHDRDRVVHQRLGVGGLGRGPLQAAVEKQRAEVGEVVVGHAIRLSGRCSRVPFSQSGRRDRYKPIDSGSQDWPVDQPEVEERWRSSSRPRRAGARWRRTSRSSPSRSPTTSSGPTGRPTLFSSGCGASARSTGARRSSSSRKRRASGR